ncbi:hypothetical protein ISS08_00145 [Candidatus Pacearchaeota archaeon]|nr:hypothetical protein [Candidatus Pacearchaeota archaeon]
MPEKEKISKSKQGKKNRAAGARFELKVRTQLESEGWIIDKWGNNVDFEEPEGKLVKAKRKYNPFMKIIAIGTGFPDFICFKLKDKQNYDVIGVEVKSNGYLDKTERAKAKFYLKNKIFSKFLIAKSKKEGRRILVEYVDFKDKYNKT